MQSKNRTSQIKLRFGTAKAEIETANKEFMAFYAAGDTMGVANSYTEDGKVMNAGAPSVGGKNNIASLFARMIK